MARTNGCCFLFFSVGSHRHVPATLSYRGEGQRGQVGGAWLRHWLEERVEQDRAGAHWPPHHVPRIRDAGVPSGRASLRECIFLHENSVLVFVWHVRKIFPPLRKKRCPRVVTGIPIVPFLQYSSFNFFKKAWYLLFIFWRSYRGKEEGATYCYLWRKPAGQVMVDVYLVVVVDGTNFFSLDLKRRGVAPFLKLLWEMNPPVHLSPHWGGVTPQTEIRWRTQITLTSHLNKQRFISHYDFRMGCDTTFPHFS